MGSFWQVGRMSGEETSGRVAGQAASTSSDWSTYGASRSARAAAARPAGYFPAKRESETAKDDEILELAARLEVLARAQEDARGSVDESDPNYAAAFERLFIAGVGLNPMHAAEAIPAVAVARS